MLVLLLIPVFPIVFSIGSCCIKGLPDSQSWKVDPAEKELFFFSRLHPFKHRSLLSCSLCHVPASTCTGSAEKAGRGRREDPRKPDLEVLYIFTTLGL